ADAGAVIHVLPGHEGGRLAAANPWQLVVKRVIDIIGATLALAVLSPVLLITALAVRLSSPGPVIHRQIRIGQDGEPFIFLKFRSMYIDAEHLKKSLTQYNEAEGPIFKIRQDPRITPVGRWIRKLSIDEMPQLLHVLTGRMSLVGPRPHLPEEVAVYDGEARRRLAVRPGVTGIWQVSGRSDLDFETWIAMDLEYLDHWSLWLDLKLMARTFTAVLSGRGAY
ncbi:MAG: sugar transferase, partial [Acidimicrobiia bacterium]|nr:sugar transferase [Acidimicrobiia bacterium]